MDIVDELAKIMLEHNLLGYYIKQAVKEKLKNPDEEEEEGEDDDYDDEEEAAGEYVEDPKKSALF